MNEKGSMAGWIGFAAIVMLIIGFIDFFQGLIALLKDNYYVVTPSGFLGILSRRFSGRGEWLGADGSEWTVGAASDTVTLSGSAVAVCARGAGGLTVRPG